MKRLIYLISALMLLASCGEKGGTQPQLTLKQKLCTEWHSTTVSLDADIYISFADNGTFELYQKIVEGAYRLYRGTWNLEEDLLTGKYNDGEDWAAAYKVTIVNNVLTLTSYNDTAEESVFEKAKIPSEIKETCEIEVRSR
ncbi:MAG: lipocalin family protein [Bacteroidales bacterium]|nr:lipocalin family protein [Bacteroidales bacterium]MBR5862745.1 lipocalin family protein [Bacteroidales bacterium]